MPAAKPNIFNIPASAPFLPVLIDALRAGKLVSGFPASREPLELARATLYLPTRRACRLAREVFLDRLDTEATWMKTRSPSPKRRPPNSPPPRWNCRTRLPRSNAGCCWPS